MQNAQCKTPHDRTARVLCALCILHCALTDGAVALSIRRATEPQELLGSGAEGALGLAGDLGERSRFPDGEIGQRPAIEADARELQPAN